MRRKRSIWAAASRRRARFAALAILAECHVGIIAGYYADVIVVQRHKDVDICASSCANAALQRVENAGADRMR